MKKLLFILFIVNCQLAIVKSQWTQLPNLPVSGTVYDMFFVNPNTGWVTLTNNFYTLKTTDGGQTWQIQLSGTSVKAGRIQFFNDTLGVALGSDASFNSIIIKTTNGGTNWNVINSSSNIYQDMYFINKDTGWVCGWDGFNDRIWRTTNGGMNFQTLYQVPGGGRERIFMLNQKVNGEYWGWTFGSTVLYKTTNSGFNWTLINNLGGGCQSAYDIYFKDTANGIITRNLSCFSITTDGGYNWTHVYEFNSLNENVAVGDSMKGWLSHTTDTIFKTTNFFQTYDKQLTPSNGYVLFALDTSIVYGSRNMTNVIKTTNGGGPLVGIEQISNVIPAEFSLGQNFPNPFNPQTSVEFSLSKNAYVSIVIYDILGKEVSVALNNEYITAGTYKAVLDFSKINVSSGAYFYKILITDEGSNVLFTETKKLVYLK